MSCQKLEFVFLSQWPAGFQRKATGKPYCFLHRNLSNFKMSYMFFVHPNHHINIPSTSWEFINKSTLQGFHCISLKLNSSNLEDFHGFPIYAYIYTHLFIDFSMQNPSPAPAPCHPQVADLASSIFGSFVAVTGDAHQAKVAQDIFRQQVRCLGLKGPKGLEGLEGWWGWDGFFMIFWGIRGWDATDDSWLLMVAGWWLEHGWIKKKSHHIGNVISSRIDELHDFSEG